MLNGQPVLWAFDMHGINLKVHFVSPTNCDHSHSVYRCLFTINLVSAERCNCTAKFGYCHNMSSVCLHVTECIVTKRLKLASTLVWRRNSSGFPLIAGAQNRVGWLVLHFVYSALYRKRWKIELKLQLLVTNRKSCMCFRFVHKSMNLYDLERWKTHAVARNEKVICQGRNVWPKSYTLDGKYR